MSKEKCCDNCSHCKCREHYSYFEDDYYITRTCELDHVDEFDLNHGVC